VSLAGLPETATDATVPMTWRCLKCGREWTTGAVADVCCPDCGTEGAACTTGREIRGPSA